MKERRERLPPEPASSEDPASVVLISLRLPSGERLERRFHTSDQLQVEHQNNGHSEEGTTSLCPLPIIIVLTFLPPKKGQSPFPNVSISGTSE